MATIDLPLFWRNCQSRELAAALSECRAADEPCDELLRRLMSRVKSEDPSWQNLTRSYIDEFNTRLGLDYIRLQMKHAQRYAVLANLGDIVR